MAEDLSNSLTGKNATVERYLLRVGNEYFTPWLIPIKISVCNFTLIN